MNFRLKFHRDCAAKAAPACGLPSEYVDFFVDLLRDGKYKFKNPHLVHLVHQKNKNKK